MSNTPQNQPDTAAWNYFNYFTEIEDHFRRARGTGLFLLSPLDWALVESWKNAGIPLEAALRGIDIAFQKWHSRKNKRQNVNSVAYCAQAVSREAQVMLSGGIGSQHQPVEAPFSLDDLKKHLATNANILNDRYEFREIAEALERIHDEADTHYSDLEKLEQRLTALEDKMAAIAKCAYSEDELLEARQQMEASLRPYRSKMTTEQLAMLERQYLERRILENARLPRLSLFYLVPGL